MKKICVLFSILLTVSACSKSNEKKIDEEFNKYVKLNFDDPNSLKEIVSIAAKDTISIESNRSILKDCINFSTKLDTLDSEFTVKLTKFSETVKNITKEIPEQKREKGLFLLAQFTNCFTEGRTIQTTKHNLKSKSSLLMDSLKYESPKYGYIIKYRQIENNELKLNSCAAYIDSASQKVYIKPNGWQIDDENASQQFNDLIKLIGEIHEHNDIYFKNIKTKIDLLDEINSLIND